MTFGEKLAVLACPCNQFGLQENLKGEEIYMSLKHVRPGDGYEPSFALANKLDVNGSDAHPLFKFLRFALPERSDTGFSVEADQPIGIQKSGMKILWTPSNPTDIVWNFEKVSAHPIASESGTTTFSTSASSFRDLRRHVKAHPRSFAVRRELHCRANTR